MPSGGWAYRSALYSVGVINERDASRKASQVSIRDVALWSAIAIIQRSPSIGTNTACNAKNGGSGCVSTSFQSDGALGGIATTTVAYRRSTPTSVSAGRSQPSASNNVAVSAPRPDASTTRSAARVSERSEPLTNRTPRAPAPPSAGTIPVTRLAGRSVTFGTASARRRSTRSISGRVAQSTDIPKSRFGSTPTTGRSNWTSRANETGTAPAAARSRL